MLPDFNADGVLDPGFHRITLAELQGSYLVSGPADCSPEWDSGWRAQLVENLAILVRQLWNAGISRIWVDGSFVEANPHPGDIDGCFDLPFGRVAEVLGALEAQAGPGLWTWDERTRLPVDGDHPKFPMWHRYRVELFPLDFEWYELLNQEDKEEQIIHRFAATRPRSTATGARSFPKGMIELVR